MQNTGETGGRVTRLLDEGSDLPGAPEAAA